MSPRKDTPIIGLAILLALLAASKPLAAFLSLDPVWAQSPSPAFTPPDGLPQGTKVRIDGSSSMATINTALKKAYEKKYAGSGVALAEAGTDAALKALLAGQIDIAAIGRPLTNAERNQGLKAVPIARHKIAIIVGPNNSFKGNISFEQFAKIFRGEITDWSQLGGTAGPIRFIDRPEFSDTRAAFQGYPVFQSAPFKAGDTAKAVSKDSTTEVIQALGTDGIGYAIADQVLDRQDIHIVPMHKTLPDDSRYPFSQPLAYVYKGTPSPAVLSFLSVATAPESQPLIEAARESEAKADTNGPPPAIAEAAPSTSATPSPSPSASTTPAGAATTRDSQAGGLSPWWLLPLLLGIPLLWWLLKGRGGTPAATPPASGPGAAPGTVAPVPPAATGAGAPIGDAALVPDATMPTATVPEPTIDDAAVTPEGTGLPGGAIATGLAAAGAGAAAVAGLGGLAGDRTAHSSIRLAPRDIHQAYAEWQTPDDHKAELQSQGGSNLMLRLYDVTGHEPNAPLPETFDEFDVEENAWNRNVPIPAVDRDYAAEIGYKTEDGRWLPLALSNSIRVSAPDAVDTPSKPEPTDGIGLPAAALAGGAVAAGAAALAGVGKTKARSQITLAPYERNQARAEWYAPEEHKSEVRQQGGETLALRLYDVTGLDLSQQRPQSYREFMVADTDTQHTTAIQYDRDYLAEIGYLKSDRRWLPLAGSNVIRVPVPAAATPAVGNEAAMEGATLAAGAGLAALAALSGDKSQSDVEAAKFNVGQSDLSSEALASVDEGLPGLPDGYGESRIVLMPRDPQWGYAYWDAPADHKEELRRQGGQRLALRLYDVTDIDLGYQSPHSLQQYDCDELARDWYVPIPVSDRDYIAEIGYLTGDGYWLLLARSSPVRIPPVYPSDWFEDHFATVAWDEDLRGKTLVNLVPPGQQTGSQAMSPIYDQVFGMAQSTEALRVAGSLFGSMQHVVGSGQLLPQQAVSSYVFPSGVGMWAVPTLSGLTMSGVGFSASMPPIRSRKFWLVADAELIVYGATEPDATVTINGRPITLNPDGTFRFQMSFQDGVLDFPIVAVAADGEQTRSIRMTFNRETPFRHTNTKDEAIDELF